MEATRLFVNEYAPRKRHPTKYECELTIPAVSVHLPPAYFTMMKLLADEGDQDSLKPRVNAITHTYCPLDVAAASLAGAEVGLPPLAQSPISAAARRRPASARAAAAALASPPASRPTTPASGSSKVSYCARPASTSSADSSKVPSATDLAANALGSSFTPTPPTQSSDSRRPFSARACYNSSQLQHSAQGEGETQGETHEPTLVSTRPGFSYVPRPRETDPSTSMQQVPGAARAAAGERPFSAGDAVRASCSNSRA